MVPGSHGAAGKRRSTGSTRFWTLVLSISTKADHVQVVLVGTSCLAPRHAAAASCCYEGPNEGLQGLCDRPLPFPMLYLRHSLLSVLCFRLDALLSLPLPHNPAHSCKAWRMVSTPTVGFRHGRHLIAVPGACPKNPSAGQSRDSSQLEHGQGFAWTGPFRTCCSSFRPRRSQRLSPRSPPVC